MPVETLIQQNSHKSMKPEKIAEFLGINIEATNDYLGINTLDRVTTAKEARNVFENTPKHSALKGAALEKWNELSLMEVQKTTTPEQIREAFNDALAGSEARRLAIQKLSEMPDEE